MYLLFYCIIKVILIKNTKKALVNYGEDNESQIIYFYLIYLKICNYFKNCKYFGIQKTYKLKDQGEFIEGKQIRKILDNLKKNKKFVKLCNKKNKEKVGFQKKISVPLKKYIYI